MKTQFQTITDLAHEIERQEEIKKDLLVSNNAYFMNEDDISFHINKEDYPLTDYAHSQVSEKLKIPKKYYDAMGQIPGLRSHNVNAWLKDQPGKKRLIRTLDGRARAFLSDKFKPLDNIFIMSAFLSAVADICSDPDIDLKKIEIKSGLLTEKRLYLQCTFPNMEAEIKKGDPIKWGIMIVNSEVGASAVDIKSLVWRLVCENGMIGESILRRYHVGSRINQTDEENMDIFQDDTIRAELKSFQLRIRDILIDSLNPKAFDEIINKMKTAVSDKISKPIKTIENVTRHFNLLDSYADPILENMSAENNINRYGIANGISYLAHEIENQDTAYELEKISSKVIDLQPGEWERLNAVA